jgi:hypothetical protein
MLEQRLDHRASVDGPIALAQELETTVAGRLSIEPHVPRLCI